LGIEKGELRMGEGIEGLGAIAILVSGMNEGLSGLQIECGTIALPLSGLHSVYSAVLEGFAAIVLPL
jgi:hypothetical protein